MKAFRFSLEQILELRLEEEQEAEIRLGRAVGEWNRLNRAARERQEQKAALIRGGGAADLFQSSLYRARLEQEIRRFQEEMAGMEPRLAALREEYRRARAAREGLDKLKEKRREEHKAEAFRRETLFLDDLSMSMTRMRKGSE